MEAESPDDAWSKETAGNLHDLDDAGCKGKRRERMSGLYDYGFRDYLPESNRWMASDPIRNGANWYAYGGNDPANYVDPWGLSEVYAAEPGWPCVSGISKYEFFDVCLLHAAWDRSNPDSEDVVVRREY